MKPRTIHATDLQWESLALWILEWEGVDYPEPTLTEWSTELAAAATGSTAESAGTPRKIPPPPPRNSTCLGSKTLSALPYADSPRG